MSIHIYSIINDFPNQIINATCLNIAILNSSIPYIPDEIGIEGDVVNVEFIENLTSSEILVLDGLVANHDINCQVGGNNDSFSGDGRDIVLSFGGHSKDYIRFKKSSYETQREFIYRGSDIIGTPINIKIIAEVKSSSKKASFRLYDSTNALTICELSNINNSQFMILDLGTITNIPTTESILEIQGKKIDSGAELRVFSLILEF